LGFVQGVHPLAVKPGDPIYLNDLATYSAVSLAYTRFNEPDPVNVRSILHVRDDYVIMHDDLHLSSDISCKWHLQVVANAHQGNAACGYVFQGRFGVDLQVLFPGQVFQNESVEHLPIHDYKAAPEMAADHGGYFYSGGHRRNVIRPSEECFATHHLMVHGAAPRYYLAVLRPLAGDRQPVKSTSVTSGGKTLGVAVQGEDMDDVIFLSRDAFDTEFNGVRFAGRYGAVLRRPGMLQLDLLAGETLVVDGIRIVSNGPSVHLEIKPDGAEMIAEGSGRLEIHGLGKPAIFTVNGNRTTARLKRDWIANLPAEP
jgi:hypothetical protein